LKTALTVLWGFLEPMTCQDSQKFEQPNTKIHDHAQFFYTAVTFDLTFFKPAKWSMDSTVLPAFIPVVVGAGQRYTYME